MLSTLAKLEVVIAGKVYHFLSDINAPLEHVKEALFQFGKYVGQIEDSVKATQTAVQPEAPVVPPAQASQPVEEAPKA
jgi:hypothetical protein